MPCKRKTVVLEEFENYVLHKHISMIAGTYINDSKRLDSGDICYDFAVACHCVSNGLYEHVLRLVLIWI